MVFEVILSGVFYNHIGGKKEVGATTQERDIYTEDEKISLVLEFSPK